MSKELKSELSLDEYASTKKLTDSEKKIICGFMDLKPETRKDFYNVFSKIFDEELHHNPIYDSVPKTAAELEAMYPPIERK